MPQTSCRVLFLEDDKIDQMLFERMVREEKLNYQYTIAESVSEAINLLKSRQFDVVIADYMLKDGTSFEILDSVRGTPIVFATGAGNEKLAVKAMKAGAYDYLIKNPDHSYLAVLPHIVENAINHSRMKKEVEQYHEHLGELVKKRTEQLAAEKELLSATFASMAEGVVVVNANKQILLLNEVAAFLVEVKLDQARNMPINDVFQLVDERSRKPIQNPIDEVLGSGNVQTGIGPCIIVPGNGQNHPVSVSVSPTGKTQGFVGGAVMLLHDLSQEREIDRMKTDFVSSVSHELRTPLTSIKAYTETILRDPNMPEETRREFLLAVDDESNRLTDLVSDLLEISQLQSGNVKLVCEDVNITEVIKKIVSSQKCSADKKNIKLEVCTEITSVHISGNESKIRSMISNLVNNAIKFTPEGGRIRVIAQRKDKNLQISVSDTGVGIPEEELSKIFDRFYRVRQSGQQIPGTGLGLAIVSEIAMLHGGRVKAESKLGEGTTFIITLPLNNKPNNDTIDKKQHAMSC